jgi:16S rRNA (cytosine967-C5)-methyltransferase
MQKDDEKLPLWQQLQACAAVIQAVRNGSSGTSAMETVAAPLRPGVQALAFHVWRNLGRAQALCKQLAAKQPPPAVEALLCTALALAWSDTDAPYDSFTLVNQAVEAAKRQVSTRAQGNFVNACLRRFLREREALVAATDHDPVALWNHPAWWIQRVQHDHPHDWQAMLTEANLQAPMTLRPNIRKSSRDSYLTRLNEFGLTAKADGPTAICLDAAVPVQRLPGFQEGVVSVQDGAAQMAAPLLLKHLPLQSGLRILDACAAPGGKTGHLLELCDAQVTTLDVDPLRNQRIAENLTRLGLEATVLRADAAQPSVWWDGLLFDGILLDAPCTASGIVRRHPDVRWLRRESDIAQLAVLQKKMLTALWPLLRPGGTLLYCTCSVFSAEGQDQIQTFLAHNTDASLLPSPGHLKPQSRTKVDAIPDNQARDHDGFFYALLQKRPV